MKRVLGKSIVLKADGKLLAGNTDIKYSNTLKTESSLIKEDDGEEKDEVVGNDRKISISGIHCVTAEGEDATHTDTAALEVLMDAGTEIPFVYGSAATGEPERSGNLMLLSLNEDSASSGYATWSAEAKILKTGYTLGTTS